MQYINKLTGALIETECAVSGEHWVRVETPAPKRRSRAGGGRPAENNAQTQDNEPPASQAEQAEPSAPEKE